jgi:hypothetical protein
MAKPFEIKLRTVPGQGGPIVRITPAGKSVLRRADSDSILITNEANIPVTVFSPANAADLFKPVPLTTTLAPNTSTEWSVRPLAELPKKADGSLSDDASFKIVTNPKRDGADHTDVHWDC